MKLLEAAYLRARLPIDNIAETLVRGGRELVGLDDPLEAEAWASAFFKT